MNVPLRTSFMRTLTPQVKDSASPPPERLRRKRGKTDMGEPVALAQSLDPDRRGDGALLAPGCGRSICRACACEHSIT
jgi:hypothetical protein